MKSECEIYCDNLEVPVPQIGIQQSLFPAIKALFNHLCILKVVHHFSILLPGIALISSHEAADI